ncbi:hypothetical protein ACSBR1_034158 [Camellia fascicularis]
MHNIPHTNYYYLVDVGYTNGKGFLAPYRACCLLHNFIQRETTVDPIEDDSDLEDALENQPPMGDDFIEIVETCNEWTEWRDTLAIQLHIN